MLLTDYNASPEPAERDCGRRKVGGAYWKTEVGEGGTPIWKFLVDPPLVLDFNDFGISAQGIKLIPDEEGTFHAWDWVGAKYWPYFPDHYEEGCRYGFSGYVPTGFDWSKVAPGKSYRKLVHPRGAVANAAELWGEHRMFETCKTRTPPHTDLWTPPFPQDWHCISFLWELLPDDEPREADRGPGAIWRSRKNFKYAGWNMRGIVPQWQPAYVMRLPLTCVEVINDPDNGTHEQTIERIDRANPDLPIALVEE